ncbi:hypothetical protein [uncultured Sulfitobacter sp.]|nr:hypothetical protein [uncultured Sulfitobacter sp.]
MAENRGTPDVHGEGFFIHRVAARHFRQDPEAVFDTPRAIEGDGAG